jgi:hypothetical protein
MHLRVLVQDTSKTQLHNWVNLTNNSVFNMPVDKCSNELHGASSYCEAFSSWYGKGIPLLS